MDSTESMRKDLALEINRKAADMTREDFEKAHGKVWNTRELSEDFAVVGFAAPFVVAVRKADGVKGSLEFSHNPRFYWGFQPE